MTEQCWVILEQYRTEVDGYVPALITVGNPDPEVASGQGDSSRPWVWGQNPAQAQEVCDKANADDYGLTHVQARDIVAAFLEADPDRWATGPCWLTYCRAPKCNGVQHVDRQGDTWDQFQGMAYTMETEDFTAYDPNGEGEFTNGRDTWRIRGEFLWCDHILKFEELEEAKRYGATLLSADQLDRLLRFTAWQYNGVLDEASEYAQVHFEDLTSPGFAAAFLAVFHCRLFDLEHDPEAVETAASASWGNPSRSSNPSRSNKPSRSSKRRKKGKGRR
ncbi:hypothetical protein JNUCC0626_19765 [Lentzea sp. JNUCC 0626]|uniref:hypothetical protein n=1 Tax=Lentzea sp. JNUCC 0626 TaxID=3367513 RepID=UPI0037491818